MLPSLVACLTLVAQQGEPAGTPFDRVLELEITADDELAIEGRGPTLVVEYEVLFDGTLHLWATSELDLFLQVDDVDDASPLASDDNSGGGTTPYLRLEVERGDRLAVLVAGTPGDTGALALHLVADPGSGAEQAAASREARRLYRMGDLAGARALDELVVEARERTLPEYHPDLLAARANLAVTMRQMGDLTEARKMDELILEARERTLPRDHPDILVARSSLANSMRQMGDLAEALELDKSVLEAAERTLPEDHPRLLSARNNLAISMSELGDLDGARALREAVLAASERTLPEDHPELARARLNLAVSMREMGDLAGARALEESAVASMERTLPRDHPDLLVARRNLAVSMGRMGDVAGARVLEESVVSACERTLPEDHPEFLRARANLAASMAEMGDLAGALALREVVLEARERTLPEGHRDLLSARANFANSLAATGDLAGARALREKILEARARTLRDDHPDLLWAQASLAASMHAMGDLAEARALREEVLAGSERTLPADHDHLLAARAALAASMLEMGDVEDARALLPALVSGMRARVLASLALAPREARQTVGSESVRSSLALSSSESAGPQLARSTFALTETMRLVVGEAARSLELAEKDPELAPILDEAAEVRSALNDLIAGAGREEAATEEISRQVTMLASRRDRLERSASRKLAERGVVARAVDVEALATVLAAGEAAVGFRRIAQWPGDEDHLLAHVLTADGELTRVDLGLASELEQLAWLWRSALGTPLPRTRGAAPDRSETESRGVSPAVAPDGDELSTGRRLRTRILDPILAITGEDVRRLFVCPDDLLYLLPLDALPCGSESDGPEGQVAAEEEDPARIGDRLRVVNEVSFARLLRSVRPTGGGPSLLSCGGVDYDAAGAAPEGIAAVSAPIVDDGSRWVEEGASDGGTPRTRGAGSTTFRALPQSGREAEVTAGIFARAFDAEPVLLTGKQTTKAALFEAAPGKRYVHLASHGWFAPETVKSNEDESLASPGSARMGVEERVRGLAPMTLCGLALAGANRGRDSLGRVPGILTAEELCSLDLSQCELAVLSACETNVGIRRAGQGIQSLQAALYAAGARTSITSLWKVDDAATRDLMETFYSNLWLEGMGKAEALWEAKKALRADGDPPAHWAGWVLTGDPD